MTSLSVPLRCAARLYPQLSSRRRQAFNACQGSQAGKQGHRSCFRLAAATSEGPLSSAKASPSFSKKIPEGDERERLVCDDCGFIDYKNPKIVVAAVTIHGDSVLLCRRGIEPRKGTWGIPQGFLELGETLQQGIAREALEEANAVIRPGPILAVYEVPGIVQICFFAEVVNPAAIKSGVESLETRLFHWDELPTGEELAFPTVGWALAYARSVLKGEGASSAGAADGSGDPASAQGIWPRFVVPEQRVKVMPPAAVLQQLASPPAAAADAANCAAS